MEKVGAARLELLVQGGDVVGRDVDVEEVRLDDLAVRPRRLALAEMDVAAIPVRVAVGGRIRLPLVDLEAELVAVVRKRFLNVGDDQDGSDASESRD
jgi:hypothetical protein